MCAIQFDPDDDDIDNDIRIMTDANPPDGLIGGPAGVCDQSGEDVTISIDSDENTVTFLDNNTGAAVETRTDTVIEDLQFVFRDSDHVDVDSSDDDEAVNVVYVETRITIRSRTIDPASGAPATRTLSQEVKIRSRG